MRLKQNEIKPSIRAETFSSIDVALKEANQFDLCIIDGAPHSSSETKKACLAANMVIIPTSESLDDLKPSVVLAHNLQKAGVKPRYIAFALFLTADSVRELDGAREYLASTPYQILPGYIPHRLGFKAAMDKGKAITEVSFPTLRKKADEMAQHIIDITEDTIADQKRETA